MANSLLGAVKIALPDRRSRRSAPPPLNKDEAAKREAARKDALQNYVTFVYYTNLAESYRSVVVTWCKSPTEHSLSMSLDEPSARFTCKIDFESGHAWGKKGLKSFEIEKARLDVFWDFRHAKFSNNPQPSSGYYVALVYKKEVALLLGDLEKDAYERTKSKPSPEKAKLLCKRENVSGKKMFCTKAMLYDGEKEHDIVIETSLTGPDDPEMWISIDGLLTSRIMNLNWKFRGNEILMVNNLPVHMFWDVHDWLFNEIGSSGRGVFIFKPGILDPCSSEKSEDSSKSDIAGETQSLIGFCHFLYAWRTS